MDIINQIREIQDLKQSKDEFSSQLPKEAIWPISELGAPRTDGNKCQLFNGQGTKCNFIGCHPDHIRKHCRLEHDWVNPQGKGRPETGREMDIPWISGVHCQHFFTRGTGAEYFEVVRFSETQQTSPGEVDEVWEAEQQIIEAMEAQADKEAQAIQESDEGREPSPWLNRVGWISHLVGLDREKVRALAEPAGEEEIELQILGKAFEWLIQDSQYHAVRQVVGLEALFIVNKKEVDKEPQMPFSGWMDMTTIISYVDVWKRLLFYIFRAESAQEDMRPPYKLTRNQRWTHADVKTSIQEFQLWKETRESMSIDESEEESEEEIAQMKIIQHKVLTFCMALLNHPLGDSEYKNVIISGMAVLGMREDTGWLEADEYTTKYSAVIKLARLMVVQEAYTQRRERVQKHIQSGLDVEKANEVTDSHYQLISAMVREFMTMAQGRRNPTPMQWLYKSRTYGFKIRYTTTAEGNIQWIQDEVLYPRVRFSMTQLRIMVHGVIHEAREILFNDLMMVGMNADGEVGEKSEKEQPPLPLALAFAPMHVSYEEETSRNNIQAGGGNWLFFRLLLPSIIASFAVSHKASKIADIHGLLPLFRACLNQIHLPLQAFFFGRRVAHLHT